MEALGQLFAAGVDTREARERHVYQGLPTYPFQRERYWLPPATGNAEGKLRRLDMPFSDEVRFDGRLSAQQPALLADHCVFDRVVAPAAFQVLMALDCLASLGNPEARCLCDLAFTQALTLDQGSSRKIQVILAPLSSGEFKLRLASCSGEEQHGAHWISHAEGRVIADHVATETVMNLAQLRARCPASVATDTFYAGLREIGFGLGPCFRRLRHIQRGDREALGEIVLSPEGFDAGALDACFQLLTLFWPEKGVAQVPFAIGAVRLLQARLFKGSRLWCLATGDGDLTLFDEHGVILGAVEGFRFRAAQRATLVEGLNAPTLLSLAWQPVELAPVSRANASSWVIVHDQGGVGSALAAAFRHRGLDVCTWPELPATPAGVIDLRALDLVMSESAGAPALQQKQQEACQGLFDVVRSLASRGVRASLWLVARGAHSVAGDEGAEPLQAALLAAAGVISREHPELSCRTVDLDPSAPADESERLADLLTAPPGGPWSEDTLAHRGGRLLALRLQSGSSHAAPRLDPEAVYLITGGLGGVGLACAAHLVRRGARRLVLSGRRGSAHRAGAALSELGAAGAIVSTVSVDVADAEAMSRLLSEIRAGGRPLRGIIHAAGVVSDGAIFTLADASIETVLKPKVAGAWILHQLTATDPLDFMIYCASAAGLVGSRGQAAYAAANGFLDGLAAYRRARGLQATAIDWGAWADIGMAAADGAKISNGLTPMPAVQALIMLDAALVEKPARVVAMSADWGRLALNWQVPPARFAALLPAPPQTPQPNSSWSREGAHAQPEAQRRDALADLIRRSIAEVGRLALSEIEPRARLFDLGFDSVMVMELRDLLQSRLGLTVTSTLLFDFPTAEALHAHLHGLLNETPSAETASPTEPLPVNLQSDLASLSDAEAEALLLAELDGISRSKGELYGTGR